MPLTKEEVKKIRNYSIFLLFALIALFVYFGWQTNQRINKIEKAISQEVKAKDSIIASLNLNLDNLKKDTTTYNDSIKIITNSLETLEKENNKNKAEYERKKKQLLAQLTDLSQKLKKTQIEVTKLKSKLGVSNTASDIVSELNIPLVNYGNKKENSVAIKNNETQSEEEETEKADEVEIIRFYVSINRKLETDEKKKITAKLVNDKGGLINIIGNIEEVIGSDIGVIFDIPKNSLNSGRYKAFIYYSYVNGSFEKQFKIGESSYYITLK